MSSSSLIYVIPPYLLNTCIGSKLQHDLAKRDSQLSSLNVISTDSDNFHSEKSKTEGHQRFSDDPYLNEIIREKVLYKLAVIGALGDNPMEFVSHDTGYLYEQFLVFKHRLLQEEGENAASNGTEQEAVIVDTPGTTKTQSSMFSSSKVGEVNFSGLSHDFPPQYKKYHQYSLKELLLATKKNASHKYKFPSSFVRLDNARFFEYPLPISWVPFVPNVYLEFLDGLGLEIDNSSGHSVVKLSTSGPLSKFSSLREDMKVRSKFCNFISDKPVRPSTGIFYYEIEVEQEATEASGFRPILAMKDQSVSSDSSLYLCAGFTKKYITLEATPNNNIVNQATSELVNLEQIKTDIFSKESNLINESVSEDIEDLLGHKPGDFKGSYAVSFEDSAFYNSVKSSESLQRTAILNMNRRSTILNRSNPNQNDTGRIDIGIPFKTRLVSETPSKRLYKTDSVGCGINFIDKSLFITLNGVLARVITEEELASSSPLKDNLFNDGFDKSKMDNSVYPMIGFGLNDIDPQEAKEPSTLQVRTNFGFKEFKFNIANYVKNFKLENQKFLYLSLLDKIQSSKAPATESAATIEQCILNVNDDCGMLNKLIKGYLNHEGYLDTFKSFNADLKNLSQEIDPSNEPPIDDSVILSKSQAIHRQTVKNYLMKNEFDLLLKFLSINYAKVWSSFSGSQLIFKINLLKFIYLLKNYLEHKFKVHEYEFDFELQVKDDRTERELYERALSFRNELHDTYHLNAQRLEEIDELSAVFLVNDRKGLESFPKLMPMFDKYTKLQTELLAEINRMILQSLGFKQVSNLESIFDNVNKNINALSLQHHDDKFSLVNFERDHMDL
ncbi:hypothetical protein G9P44_000162 [Scheffersomyces stipitis]|nr:hypothetical protein G9P44_000162 [Scheffersomyces stipitis]